MVRKYNLCDHFISFKHEYACVRTRTTNEDYFTNLQDTYLYISRIYSNDNDIHITYYDILQFLHVV